MEEERRKSRKIVIDFIELIKVVRNDKRMMGIFLFISAVLGLAVAFGTPKEYKASVMLAPETATGNSLTSNISSIASMVGMDMDFSSNGDAIYPELYPDLIGSNDFIVSLFPIKVTTKDGSLTTDYYDYLLNHNKNAWYTYPARLLTKVVQSLKTEDVPFTGDSTKVNPFHLSKMQDNIAHKIGRSISCTVDKKTSVIAIEVTDQDPVISATMADSIKNRLQAFITQYRTQKARNDLAYMEKLFVEAKEEYVTARQQYAAYSDANQELILQTFRAKQEDLENEMQLKYNAYTQVYEQLQLSKAKVQEQTPAFTVVQSASVPLKHINKSKLMMMCIFMFLGAVLRVLILMWKRRREVFFLA